MAVLQFGRLLRSAWKLAVRGERSPYMSKTGARIWRIMSKVRLEVSRYSFAKDVVVVKRVSLAIALRAPMPRQERPRSFTVCSIR